MAPFYGCQILRPSKLLGFEDPDRPSSLERIIEACGGEAVDYPAKIKCCGFPIIQAREETALGELIQPIEQAKEAGADAMVTPCPLCHLSLDAWQSKLKKQTGKDFQMPILHLSQLIGVAAGLEDSELKFKRHVVSVEPGAREARASDRKVSGRLGVLMTGAGGFRLGDLGGAPRLNARSSSAVAVLAALAMAWFEAGWLRTRVLEVPVPGLPPELDGLRIAHLSDFHLGVPSRGASRSSAPSSGCAAARPDLVCVTGDLLSHPRGGARARRAAPRRPRRVRRPRKPRRRSRPRPVLAAPASWTDLAATRAAADEAATSSCAAAGSDRRRRPGRTAAAANRPELADPTAGSAHPALPLSRASSPLPRGLPPRPRRPHARRADRASLPGGQAPARAPACAPTRGPLPQAGGDAARLARARHDVRAVPLLRAARGDRARSAIDPESMEGHAVISTDILASYAADAAREVTGVHGLVESALHRHRGVKVSREDGKVSASSCTSALDWGAERRSVGAAVQARVGDYLRGWPMSRRTASTSSSTRSRRRT